MYMCIYARQVFWRLTCVYYVAELTLPQFYLFLHEMEKAKSVMDYLSWLQIWLVQLQCRTFTLISHCKIHRSITAIYMCLSVYNGNVTFDVLCNQCECSDTSMRCGMPEYCILFSHHHHHHLRLAPLRVQKECIAPLVAISLQIGRFWTWPGRLLRSMTARESWGCSAPSS